MQYNFYVDGKWRHDEQQPFVNEIFGVVNSIYLLRQPDILSTLLSAETPGGGHMEVDNSASGPVVSFFSLPIFVPLHHCMYCGAWIVC